LGGDAIAVVADASEFEQVKAIADRAVAVYGRLDTWVHVSGTSVVAPFDQISPEEFKRVIDVNPEWTGVWRDGEPNWHWQIVSA
jgi:NAD(P)-dependent dehydrogenase (short-subunit alcohol dehydrogenase family)